MKINVYDVWLSTAVGGSGRICRALREDYGGAERIYKDKLVTAQLGAAHKGALAKRDLTDAERIVAECERRGYFAISTADEKYPPLLGEIYDPPEILYGVGELPDFDERLYVACVGTRNATDRGMRIIERLCRQLAMAGVVIVAGMAAGIDAAAHLGAIKCGGSTVAVLGTAIDKIYPASNADIYRAASKNGAVISEHAPGEKTYKDSFPKRNRIISGLSRGVIVSEAPSGSGALITAAHAFEQNRDIFVVPANIDNAVAVGSNTLLKGGAKPVLSAIDVIEEYVAIYPEAFAKAYEQPEKMASDRDGEPAPRETGQIELDGDEKTVMEAFVELRTATLDEIVVKTGLPAAAVSRSAIMLQIKNYIDQLPGGRFTVD